MGRSQIAEAFFRKYYPEHNVRSAGFIAHDKGKNISPRVLKALKRYDIDASMQKCKKLTTTMVKSSDMIVLLLTADEHCPNFLKMTNKTIFWKIQGPHEKSLDFLLKTINKIKNKVYKMDSSQNFLSYQKIKSLIIKDPEK